MGWNKITVKRRDLVRVGGTPGKNLSTVRAIRFTVNAYEGGPGTEVRFDDTRISGGANRGITGEVQHRYVYVRNDGTYVAKSAPSAPSPRINLEAQGVTVRVPADASRDPQVNEIWLYRIGGGLDDWYRSAVKTGVSGTGAVDIDDTLSAAEVLTIGIRLESDNTVPPDNIIGVEGPYFDRLFALTATHLYPSRRRNPDSFSTGQAIQVAGADETALWVRKTLGGLYIGTTKDIYRLAGDGAEYPDGTINFTLTPLNIDNPPISPAVAQEGNFLVYMAADGWRAVGGAGSELLTGDTSLLYQGRARHGVSPVNVVGGRFRAAITKGQLTAIMPEGSDVASSKVLYRRRISVPRWSRFTYQSAWRSILREPDGTLVAGDNAGFVWVLDSGSDDGGVKIPVVMLTKEDDLGYPFQRKDPYDLRVLADTGGAAATIEAFVDGGSVAVQTLAATLSGMAESPYIMSGAPSFRRLQLKIAGSFSSFRWTALQLGFHALPQMVRGHTAPTNFGYPGVKTVSGLQIRICTLGQSRSVTVYLDNSPVQAFSVGSAVDEPVNATLAFSEPKNFVEAYLSFDGDVELYDWSPLITHKRPLGVLSYDSGPLDLGIGEIIWPREVWMKVDAAAPMTVECRFDGVIYPTVTATPERLNVPVKMRIPLPRGYFGRVPRFIIYSTGPFFPYWFEFVIRQTRARLEKNPVRVGSGLGGEVAT